MARWSSPVPELNIPGDCYLVGGAVRDELLDLKPQEFDWVVVGTTAKAMLDAGFKQVGKAYPVFLDPKHFQEYALARRETKTGPGHGGFSFESDPSVTLEEDLRRRDLTMNAIAKSAQGELIDPFNGQRDIEEGVIRHVSDAFVEDPLRCFRVARFAATMPSFEVHESTIELIRSMQPTLHELSAERVWNEWERALRATAPGRFYEVLHDAAIVEPWFVELDVAALANRHRSQAMSVQGAFALIGNLHQDTVIESLFRRLKAPNKVRDLSLQVARYGRTFERIQETSSQELLLAFEKTNALHGDLRFDNLVNAMACVIQVDVELIQGLRETLRQVKAPVGIAEGRKLGQILRTKQLRAIESSLKGETSS